MTSPVRVLHIIDQLAGGGSERLLWDAVRLAPADCVRQQVAPLMLDRGDFVYAERMAASGAYRHPFVSAVTRRLDWPAEQLATMPQEARSRRSLALIWRMACFARAAVVLPAKVATFWPHVIHAHTMHSLLAALLLKKAFRLPLIHSVPCLITQMYDIGQGWLVDVYRERHNEIDLFLTGASVDELRGLGIPERKIRPISGGVDVAAVTRTAAQRERHRMAVRAEIAADPCARVLLSVGRFQRSKGHRYAVEALPAILDAHPDVHWVVLGAGEEHRALADRARELGVEGRAHFLGFRADPLPYYAAADVYLRTAIYEAENLSSYQAMASALPVIGFDTDCATELITAVGHGVLVPSKDAAALAAGTIELLSSVDRGRSLGERGALYARDHLDISLTIASFVDAYAAVRR